MLPECRCETDPYPIPKFDLDRKDVKDLIEELKGFHEQFRDCFSRQEPRDNFFQYMVGQLSQVERKSIEPIALSVKDAKVRAMQFFVSDVAWNDENVISIYRSMIGEDMGDPDGALIFDESGFVKKGNDSAGVARQYCGTIGKVENCQVGVFAAYASRHGYGLLGSRLFVPEKWFTDEYAERRAKCKFPEDLGFKTKPQLAVELLKEIVKDGQVPFRFVVADATYGNSPDFIDGADGLLGVTYFVAMPDDTLCWLRRPLVVKKEYRFKGEIRSKLLLKDGKEPVSFETIAKNLNSFFWYRRKVSEGTKGPIEYEFTKRRVVLSRGGLPGREVWLIIRRTLDDSPTHSYFISNAGLSARLKLFVWLSGIRWAIEQCFEETKTELGMDHYEVRKFPGWVHHMMTCMLAHFFLWHLKLRLGKKSASHYSVAAYSIPQK
jgi:SRSO17 transposase